MMHDVVKTVVHPRSPIPAWLMHFQDLKITQTSENTGDIGIEHILTLIHSPGAMLYRGQCASNAGRLGVCAPSNTGISLYRPQA